MLISWMVIFSSWLIRQIISFILPPNEYGCVYAWTTLGSGPAIDLQKMSILAKKIIFSDETHFDLGRYASKIIAFGAQKTPARIQWKADASKTSHCLVGILVQRRGRIKLIICRIKHELSVTIYEISTSWKKNKR